MSKNRTALRKYKEFRKCGGADFQRQWQNELENLLQQISDGIEVIVFFAVCFLLKFHVIEKKALSFDLAYYWQGFCHDSSSRTQR